MDSGDLILGRHSYSDLLYEYGPWSFWVFRSSGSHRGVHGRRQVPTEPAGSDLHEVPSAHRGQHDWFPRGELTNAQYRHTLYEPHSGLMATHFEIGMSF